MHACLRVTVGACMWGGRRSRDIGGAQGRRLQGAHPSTVRFCLGNSRAALSVIAAQSLASPPPSQIVTRTSAPQTPDTGCPHSRLPQVSSPVHLVVYLCH